MSTMRIGFVGPGRLGGPMVERLAAAGHDLVVHARRPEIREQLGTLGIRSTPDLAKAARGRELLIVCVYDNQQLAALGDDLAAALPTGAVLASHVTGRVATLRGLAERFPDIHVVDAPVSGTADDIRTSRLTVLLGGSPAARMVAAGGIRAYSEAVIESGELGTALATKLVNNLLLAANTQLVAAAAELGTSLGITHESLLAALHHMSGGSRAGDLAAARLPLTQFAKTISPFLVKDVAACRAIAEEQGADLSLLLDVVRRGPLDLV